VSAAIRLVDELAALGAECSSREELRRETLGALKRALGIDYGVIWTPGEPAATVDGFDARFFATFAEGETLYAHDLAELAGAALAQRGVTRDVVALSPARRSASAFYADIIRPVGSRSFLTAVLRFKQRAVGLVQLGRGGAHALAEAHAERLREALSVMALGQAAHARPIAPGLARAGLAAREREVVRYVTLGFTNPEIAGVLGTSPNTVRNQLAAIFRKTGVSTRAELVAWALGALE